MFLSASEGLYVYLPIADMRVVFTRRLRSETPWKDSVPIDLPGIPGSSPTTAGFVMSFMSTTSVGCAAMLLPTYRQSRTAVMPPFAPRGRLNLGSSSGLVATRVKFFIWPPAGILSIGVRGWTPLYDSGAGDEQAATIKIASGTSEPQRANLFIDPPCRPRGREAGPSAAMLAEGQAPFRRAERDRSARAAASAPRSPKRSAPYTSGSAAADGARSAASVAATAKSRVPPPNTDATTSPPSTAVPTAAASVPAARSARAARSEPPSSAAMPPTSAFATRIASATFAASRVAPRSASRAVGTAPAAAAPTASATNAVFAVAALARAGPTTARSSANETTSVPVITAAAVSARPPTARASAGAASSAGAAARRSAPSASVGASRPIATATGTSTRYGATTATRTRGRRSARSARTGVCAPIASMSSASAASARSRRSGAGKALPESGHELRDGNADLRHRVALADRHLTIVERREVHGHAERRADLVLAPVAATDRLRLVVRRHPVRPDEIPHLAREWREPLVLRERQDRDLVRRDLRAEAQDDADALLVGLLVVRRAQQRVHRAIGADGGFDDERHESLVAQVVEVLELFP